MYSISYSLTDSYNIHKCTDNLLLYDPSRDIRLLILLTHPWSFFEPVLFSSLILDDLVCSICYRLASFQQLSCPLGSSCSLLKTAIPQCLPLWCGLPPGSDLADLFWKQMAFEDSSCILPTVFYLLVAMATVKNYVWRNREESHALIYYSQNNSCTCTACRKHFVQIKLVFIAYKFRNRFQQSEFPVVQPLHIYWSVLAKNIHEILCWV